MSIMTKSAFLVKPEKGYSRNFKGRIFETFENVEFIFYSSSIEEIEYIHPDKSIENYSEMSRRSICLQKNRNFKEFKYLTLSKS